MVGRSRSASSCYSPSEWISESMSGRWMRTVHTPPGPVSPSTRCNQPVSLKQTAVRLRQQFREISLNGGLLSP